MARNAAIVAGPHQAVATALVALACVLVRSFDRRGDPKVQVDTSTRPAPTAPSAAVSRTTVLAFSALGNTDALATSRRMSRPEHRVGMLHTHRLRHPA